MYADALSSLLAVTGLEGRISHRVSLHAPYGVVFPAAAASEPRMHVVRRRVEQPERELEPAPDPELLARARRVLHDRDKIEFSELQRALGLDTAQALQLTQELERRGELGPASPQTLSFCLVTAGKLVVELPGQRRERLGRHDLLIYSGNDPLVFRDHPHSPLVSVAELRDEIDGHPPRLTLDGVEAPGEGICGEFRYRVHLFDPLGPSIASPRIIRESQLSGRVGWLRTGLEAALTENAKLWPGALTAVEHILVVLLLDAFAATTWGGWLEAVGDPSLSQALHLIHRWPGYAWSNSELSRRCGLERTAFVDRFWALTGQTPLQYLRLWRMELAAHALADSLARAPVELAALAHELGFPSPEVFRDVFATHFGVAPERWAALDAPRRGRWFLDVDVHRQVAFL